MLLQYVQGKIRVMFILTKVNKHHLPVFTVTKDTRYMDFHQIYCSDFLFIIGRKAMFRT